MTKRLACVLLLALITAACGGGSSGGSGTPAAPTPTPTTIDELAVTLKNPDQILVWMRANLTYFAPASMDDWRYWSPQEVFASRRGDCVHHSAFVKYLLAKNGYSDLRLVFVLRNGLSTHTVPVWRGSDSKLYFLETTMLPFGVGGPFDTVNEIGSLVYARLVAVDGKTARYDVKYFDDVPFGVPWLTFINASQLIYTVS